MPACPECESELDFDVEDVDEGDIVACDECGTEFEVVATDPLELSKVDESEGGYEEDDEKLDEGEE